MTDYDSPWKEALKAYFQPFLALFFPHIDGDIDWARGHEFLDRNCRRSCRRRGAVVATSIRW